MPVVAGSLSDNDILLAAIGLLADSLFLYVIETRFFNNNN